MYILLGVCVSLWWVIAILHENHARIEMCDHVVWYAPVTVVAGTIQLFINLFKRMKTHKREHILVYGTTVHRCTKSVDTAYTLVSTALYIMYHVFIWGFVSIMVPWSPMHCDETTHNYRATIALLVGANCVVLSMGEKMFRRRATRSLSWLTTEENSHTLP